MQSPLAIFDRLRRPQSVAEMPYQRPGYMAPVVRPSAADLVRKVARWPLVWVLDIHAYDGVTAKSQGQTTFTLSAPQEGGPGTRLQCSVPMSEGDLFGKDGAYLVVVVPAEDRETVDAILRMAGQG
jgi:hypothetical protein